MRVLYQTHLILLRLLPSFSNFLKVWPPFVSLAPHWKFIFQPWNLTSESLWSGYIFFFFTTVSNEQWIIVATKSIAPICLPSSSLKIYFSTLKFDFSIILSGCFSVFFSTMVSNEHCQQLLLPVLADPWWSTYSLDKMAITPLAYADDFWMCL